LGAPPTTQTPKPPIPNPQSPIRLQINFIFKPKKNNFYFLKV